jgi:hypothetical protein
MSARIAQVINLADHVRTRALLSMEDVKEILTEVDKRQRLLNDEVIELTSEPHKLKYIEALKDKASQLDAVSSTDS